MKLNRPARSVFYPDLQEGACFLTKDGGTIQFGISGSTSEGAKPCVLFGRNERSEHYCIYQAGEDLKSRRVVPLEDAILHLPWKPDAIKASVKSAAAGDILCDSSGAYVAGAVAGDGVVFVKIDPSYKGTEEKSGDCTIFRSWKIVVPDGRGGFAVIHSCNPAAPSPGASWDIEA